MYKRTSPVVKVNITYKTKMPLKIQNSISSIYVIIFGVLNDFLVILNISNSSPITTPVAKKINRMHNSLSIFSHPII